MICSGLLNHMRYLKSLDVLIKLPRLSEIPSFLVLMQGFNSKTHFWPLFTFYTLLKTSENQRFSRVFRRYKMRTLPRNGLKRWKKLTKPVTYPEFFWADRYIHRTHKGATIVVAERKSFQNLFSRCSKNALPGTFCS